MADDVFMRTVPRTMVNESLRNSTEAICRDAYYWRQLCGFCDVPDNAAFPEAFGQILTMARRIMDSVVKLTLEAQEED